MKPFISLMTYTLPIIHELHMDGLRKEMTIIGLPYRRLSVADNMEESIIQSLKQAEAVRKSILKRGFEGRLVN